MFISYPQLESILVSMDLLYLQKHEAWRSLWSCPCGRGSCLPQWCEWNCLDWPSTCQGREKVAQQLGGFCLDPSATAPEKKPSKCRVTVPADFTEMRAELLSVHNVEECLRDTVAIIFCCLLSFISLYNHICASLPEWSHLSASY